MKACWYESLLGAVEAAAAVVTKGADKMLTANTAVARAGETLGMVIK